MEDLVAGGSDAVEEAGPGDASDAADGTAATPRAVDPNYDFSRGERPLFYEDYSGDSLGRAPTNVELVQGAWDVVDVDGQRWLRGTGGSGSDFQVVLPDVLPEQFTVEFEVMFAHQNQMLVMATASLEPGAEVYHGPLVEVRGTASGLSIPTAGRDVLTSVAPDGFLASTPVEITVDGSHMQVFVAQMKVADVPDAGVVRSDRLHFEDPFFSTPEAPVFVGRIRVDGWEPDP